MSRPGTSRQGCCLRGGRLFARSRGQAGLPGHLWVAMSRSLGLSILGTSQELNSLGSVCLSAKWAEPSARMCVVFALRFVVSAARSGFPHLLLLDFVHTGWLFGASWTSLACCESLRLAATDCPTWYVPLMSRCEEERLSELSQWLTRIGLVGDSVTTSDTPRRLSPTTMPRAWRSRTSSTSTPMGATS